MPAVFPITYFGSIAYYRKLVEAKEPQFEQWETFPRRSIRNHCSILCPNGILDLTVPVTKPNGSRSITKEIGVDYSTDWQKKHWKTLQTSYSSSPYFDHYGREIEEIIFHDWKLLIDLNEAIHKHINNWLDLGLSFELTEAFEKAPREDYRTFFTERNTHQDYSYQQVFTSKEDFIPDLSILDAIFNLGPMARKLFLP